MQHNKYISLDTLLYYCKLYKFFANHDSFRTSARTPTGNNRKNRIHMISPSSVVKTYDLRSRLHVSILNFSGFFHVHVLQLPSPFAVFFVFSAACV